MEENATTQEETTTTETVEVSPDASFFDSQNLSSVLTVSLGAILLLAIILGLLVVGKRRRESLELSSFEDDGKATPASEHDEEMLAPDEDEIKKK